MLKQLFKNCSKPTQPLRKLLKKRLDNPDFGKATTSHMSLHLNCRPAETAKLMAFNFVEFSI